MSVLVCVCVRLLKKTVNFSADQLQTVTENFFSQRCFCFSLVVVVAVNKSGMQKFPHTHTYTHTQLQFKVRKIMGKQKQQQQAARLAGKQVNDSKWLKRS